MKGTQKYSLNSEYVLLGVLVAITLWIVGGSFYLQSSDSTIFPRLAGGLVLILLILLFIKRGLPERFLEFLPDHESLSYGGDDAEFDEHDTKQVLFTFVSFGGYIVGIYVLGFMIATPLFVYLNLKYYRFGSIRQKGVIIGVIIVVTSIAYQVLRIPLDQGLIINYLL